MATPPRGNANNRRSNSRPKKPTTIDLDAKDVKDTSAPKPDTADAKNTGQKAATPSTAKPAAKPAAAQAPADKTSSSNKTSPNKTSPNKTGATGPKVTPATPDKTSAQSSKPAEVKSKTSQKPAAKKPEPVKKPTPDAPKPKQAKSGGTGFGKMAAAGIIGGVITLAGAGALQYNNMLPNFGQSAVAPATLDLSPLETKIAALESQLANLDGQDQAAVDLEPIVSRLIKLENAPAPLSDDGTVTTDGQTVQQIEQLKAGLDDLQASTQKLASQLETQSTVAPDQAATGSLIDAALAPLTKSTQDITSKLADLEGKFGALTSKIDVEVNARIDQFDEKLKNAATGEKLAKSVAINSLKSAVENGEPFSAALTSLETLSGPSEPLEGLKAFARKGVPTNASLLNEFRDLQSTIVLAASNDPDAGITDRMMTSLRSLVTISSDEALPGGTPEAIVSRIDANLKSQNFGAALSEWKTLPEPGQQASKDWMAKVNQRIDADRQLFKLMETLKSDS